MIQSFSDLVDRLLQVTSAQHFDRDNLSSANLMISEISSLASEVVVRQEGKLPPSRCELFLKPWFPTRHIRRGCSCWNWRKIRHGSESTTTRKAFLTRGDCVPCDIRTFVHLVLIQRLGSSWKGVVIGIAWGVAKRSPFAPCRSQTPVSWSHMYSVGVGRAGTNSATRICRTKSQVDWWVQQGHAFDASCRCL